uniref:Uncharacterized protein n=1 Tax=Anopheles minimus TaxID=112268 RepID=A0A182WNX0_9DIPT
MISAFSTILLNVELEPGSDSQQMKAGRNIRKSRT